MHPVMSSWSESLRSLLRSSLRATSRKRIAAGVAAVLAVSIFAAAPASATSDDKRREVEQIADELERLRLEVDTLGEDYVVAIDEKAQADAEVVKATERIAKLETRISELQGDLSKLAVQAFVSGGAGGTLTELFAPGSDPNDAVQMQHFTEIALNAGVETTDDLDALLDELEDEKDNLEYQQKLANDLAEQIAERRTAAEEAAVQFTARKQQAEAELGQLLVEEEQRRQEQAAREAQEALDRANAEAAAAAAQQNSGGGSSGGGSSGGGSSGGGSTGGGSTGGGSTGGGSTGGGSTGGNPPVSSRAGIAVNAARAQLGVPYRFAASSPGVAFDCSGLTSYAWGQAGVYLPHQSRAQFASTPRVSISAAQPGDLVYFHSPISHVGIYAGGGQMIHAPYTGSVVSYSAVNWSRVVGVTRPG
jgi:cell wall-associated NlpC family hydrolase